MKFVKKRRVNKKEGKKERTKERKKRENEDISSKQNSTKTMVGCAKWHIIPFELFNAKSCLYINIKCIWFVNKLIVGNWVHFLLKVKGLQVLLYNLEW